jgi:hypothetical protein
VDDQLRKLAGLLEARDQVEKQIAELLGRPPGQGNIGEFVASRVFDIKLASTAVQAGYDGWFRSGPLAGATVNVKAYGDAYGGIDISPHPCDYYLVLSGPRKPWSTGEQRWRIAAVYLFDATFLLPELRSRSIQIGVNTSIRTADLMSAQLYPVEAPGAPLRVTDEQRAELALFA